ncbi:3-methyl-2-oxobutanoate hydroxymethyltransferase [Granulibacter bethesdensis]|nr:3-methyl-2-oxobutanoate hydroxymethyltransferase [Granulibacter bethesdensis]
MAALMCLPFCVLIWVGWSVFPREDTVMSSVVRSGRISVPALRARKGGTPIVALTAYTAPMAGHLDPHVDVLLVGDSLGMVIYGFETTLPVTLEMMIAHAAAVVRGSSRACVIVDLPWGTYRESPEQAYRNAARLLAETGAGAVKLEGGQEMAETIAFLTARGIPVCGHVGLMPQDTLMEGGYRATGRTEDSAARVLADAMAVAEAGAFMIVLEGTLEPVAAGMTRSIAVPIIGIGASPHCDGQVLVTDDMLGLYGSFQPRFVKRYAELALTVAEAAACYAEDVRTRRFPAMEHCYTLSR